MPSCIRHTVIATAQGTHCHEYGQLLFGWQGQMDCELPTTGVRLIRGNFAISPQGMPHGFSGKNEDCALIVVDLHHQDPLLQLIEEQTQTNLAELLLNTPPQGKLAADMLPLLEFAAKRLTNATPAQQQRLSQQLLPMLLGELVTMKEWAPNLRATLQQRLDVSALEHIARQHPGDTISNGTLAAYFNLSESHFYALCQQQLGCSPQKYLLRCRLQMAREALLNTSIPVAVLASEFGFASTSAFSRAYKKHMGVSPAQTRQGA